MQETPDYNDEREITVHEAREAAREIFRDIAPSGSGECVELFIGVDQSDEEKRVEWVARTRNADQYYGGAMQVIVPIEMTHKERREILGTIKHMFLRDVWMEMLKCPESATLIHESIRREDVEEKAAVAAVAIDCDHKTWPHIRRKWARRRMYYLGVLAMSHMDPTEFRKLAEHWFGNLSPRDREDAILWTSLQIKEIIPRDPHLQELWNFPTHEGLQDKPAA